MTRATVGIAGVCAIVVWAVALTTWGIVDPNGGWPLLIIPGVAIPALGVAWIVNPTIVIKWYEREYGHKP